MTKRGPLEKGMANHFSSILALRNPMNHMKRQKDRTLKDELLRSVGAQYATGEQGKNNSRKNDAAKSLQSCPTLCNPMDCSLPSFSVHGILQARTLEWVAISFSRKNEEMQPKQKQHPVVDVTGDGSKVHCCKEQYCIGLRIKV